MERVYDPLWANARTLLDFFEEHRMIHKDLSKARIGQVVLVSGELAFADLGLIKSAWKSKAVREGARKAALAQQQSASDQPLNRAERRRLDREKDTNARQEIDAFFDMLENFPHVCQINIKSGSINTWASLDERSLITSPADLVLKHGVHVTGEWSALGILDALPTPLAEDLFRQFDSAFGFAEMWQQIASVMPTVRNVLGRPFSSYGVTPLLIFRQVGE